MLRVLRAELLKLKGSRIPLWTAIAVIGFPVISIASVNAVDPGFENTLWDEFMRFAPQQIATWYGIVLFGFVTAFLFGREHAEGTAKTMLTLPVRRESFVVAKVLVLYAWVLGLTLLAVLWQAVVATVLGFGGFAWSHVWASLSESLLVSLLVFCTLPLVGWLAMLSRGYLAPMLFSALTAVAGMSLAVAGWSRWFPWSMPNAVAGSALGILAPAEELGVGSYAIAAALFVAGVALDIWYVNRADSVQ